MEINVSVDDILEFTSRSEKRELYEELKDEYGEDVDVEDLVDDAFDSTKKRIFQNLLDEGFGDHLINDDEDLKTLEDKRFMMDKEDEAMLDYLNEKYRYFG